MNCKNCGKTLNQGELFCANCGAKVENENNMFRENTLNQNQQNPTISNFNNNINQNQQMFNQTFADNQTQMNNVYQQPINQMNMQQPTQPVKPKKNKGIKILAIIGGVIVGIILLAIIIISIVSANSDKLVCKSSEGNITIMYNKNGITGYTANGMSYDLDQQKDYAKKIGIDAYIKEFNSWFTSNTSGTCSIDGKELEKENEKPTTNSGTTNSDTTVVGDDTYGYITIPKNWGKFYDVDGNSSLQYSYANVYIVSLNLLDSELVSSAKEAATNYMYNMQNNSDVTGVTGATVTIGKNKEYTAYQVYMYYPSDSTYLITYWFESEDGKIRYIALEGPEELSGVKITDYLYIPESFSLSK